jgi:hypothetical protein
MTLRWASKALWLLRGRSSAFRPPPSAFRHALWLLVAWLLWPGGGTVAAAAQPASAEAPPDEALRFRRVYVPAGEIQDWPKGNTKYLPMEARQFDRLLEMIARSPAGHEAQVVVRAVAAHYQARLADDRRIVGDAKMEIASTAKTAVLLPLEPCNLAIGKAVWGDSAATLASLGLGSDGTLRVLVERSGTLGVDWSLRAEPGSGEDGEYRFELPACPVNHFTLDLPATLSPEVQHAIVLGSAPAAEGRRRWQIELGGQGRFRLRLSAGGPAPQRPGLVLVRQSATYDFSLRGLELSTQLKLEAYHEPLAEVAIAVEPPLQLVHAQFGDVEVPWSVVSAPGDKAARLLLVLPQPLREGAGVLQLKAVAPLTMGQPWQLPRIRADGCLWQEGSTTLVVPAALRLERLGGKDCRQTSVAALPPPESGASLSLEHFAPDAAVEVTLAESRSAVRSACGTATTLGNGKMTSRVTADFHTAEGPLFSLEAAVAPQWTIDSVESLPAEALDEWSLSAEAVPAKAAGGRDPRGGRKLTVVLARPLTPSRPVRLVVAARRLYAAPGRNLGLKDLVPLQFHASRDDSRLVALRAQGPYELRLDGAEHLHRVALQDLAAVDKDLFGDRPGELIFKDDAAAEGLEVSLDKRKPMYTAAIRVEAAALSGALQENYVLACAPLKSAEVERVLLRLAHRRDEPLRWSLDGEESALAARRLPPRPPAAGTVRSVLGRPDEEESWELLLRHPRSVAFEIRGVRLTRFDAPRAVNLASLPEAASQQATLVVRSLGQSPLRIENNRLKPVATEPVPADQYQTARATFQYDPIRDTADEAEPALVLVAGGDPAVPAAWAWDCELASRYAADGSAEHSATYRVESAGAGHLRVTLPQGTTPQDLRGAWVDQNRVSPRLDPAADPPAVVVELPAGKRLSSVAICYTLERQRFGTVARLEPPLPEIDVPVLAQHWTVSLPPGYQACDYLPDPKASPRRQWSLTERLFGVLGRAAGQTSFNPLERDDWLAAPASGPPADTAGWSVYRLEIADMATPRLAIVHGATIHAVGWLVFLLMAGAGLWKLAARPVPLTILAGATGMVAIASPAWFVPVASAAFLGVLFCFLAGWLRHVRRAREAVLRRAAAAVPDEDRSAPPSTISGVASLGALLVAAVLGLGHPLYGQQPGKNAPPAAYGVFIPVDDKQHPTGGEYYVPEPLYEQLYRRAAPQSEKPQGWLIAGATYRASLSRDATSQRLVVDQLTADYSLRVFDAKARVRIPLRHDEAKLLPDESRLDGHPIEPEWDADGPLVVDVAEPGDYRLELSLRPSMAGGTAPAGFDLAIPRLATSQLELALPAGAPAIEVPRAVGAVRREEQPPRLLADLGPVDRLSVRWQDGSGETAPLVEAEQLQWLRVAPGCVTLDARLRLRVVAGGLRRLSLLTDPQLEMLPLAGPDAPAVRVERPKGQPQIVELTWPRPITETAAVELHFVYAGVSSVGSIPLPQFEVLDVRPTRQWLAVSVDPALDYESAGRSRLEAVPAAVFLGSWGPADGAPQLTFSLPQGPAAWSLATRPRHAETTAEGTLAMGFDGHVAEVRFEAQLVTTSDAVFEQRIAAPAALRVQRVSLQIDGAERAARWAQDPTGAVTIFFAAPVTGRYKLSLAGVLPAPAGQRIVLPLLAIEGAASQSSILQLFRRPSVVLDWKRPPDWTEVTDPVVDPGLAELGRLVRCLRPVDSMPSKVAVRVMPNRPQGRAEQITRVTWDEDGWKAAVDCRVKITAGVMDEVAIDAPATWSGPYKCAADYKLKVSERPGQGNRLLLEPRATAAREYRFSVSGPLELAPSDQVVIPQVLVKQIGPLRRVLVLPKQAEGQSVAWEVQGLREVALPDDAPDDRAAAYEIVGESWKAVLQPAGSAEQSSRVRLADIRIVWQGDGSCRGLAVLDAEIEKSEEVPLWLPAGARLLHLAAGGVPIDPLGAADGAWLVPLAADSQPQRVEVLFAAGMDAVAQRCVFHAPSLGNLPVERTVWTIAGPRSFGIGKPEDAEPAEPEPAADAGGSSAAGRASPAAKTAALWQGSVDDAQSVGRYAGHGDSLTLRYAPIEADGWLARLAALLAIALVAAGIAALVERGVLGHLFARWPCAFGVALGLGWWLFLRPSALGLAIVLAVLAVHFIPRRLLTPLSLGERGWG